MSMNKNQVKGRVKEAKGMIKEVAGKLVGNEKLEAKGKVQKILGEAQAEIGDIKQDVKEAVKGTDSAPIFSRRSSARCRGMSHDEN